MNCDQVHSINPYSERITLCGQDVEACDAQSFDSFLGYDDITRCPACDRALSLIEAYNKGCERRQT
jgi:hypothetical protein